MTPKQKATEFTAKFINLVASEISGKDGFEFCKDTQVNNAKKCALICVDEMIEESIGYLSIDRNKYWQEVKPEIEKL